MTQSEVIIKVFQIILEYVLTNSSLLINLGKAIVIHTQTYDKGLYHVIICFKLFLNILIARIALRLTMLMLGRGWKFVVKF